jgi:hypothetical protein
MIRRRFGAAVLASAGLAVAAVGCSNSLSAADFEKELTSNGVSQSLASCVTTELQAKGFKFRKYGELSAEENQQIVEASTKCALKDSGLDPGAVTVPTTAGG